MKLINGSPEIIIGLLDGPVALDHPDLKAETIRELPGISHGRCSKPTSVACVHGTFIAGMLCGRRGSAAPGICPGCTVLVRSIFMEGGPTEEDVPSAKPAELAQAILDVVEAGASIINLSAAFVQSAPGEAQLQQALDHAAHKGALVVAAAGNQGMLGSSVITRHPWVVPVVAYDLQGRLMPLSNLSGSIGRRGLGAPGEGVTSLRAGGGFVKLGGTSVSAPFVTGALGLLWSCFPKVNARAIKLALTGAWPRGHSIVPPLLDAESAYEALASQEGSPSI
jgi:subtilisin family serine protease